MVTLLLIVIYIAFIGLGIPDSVFGTAWPTLYRDLELPVSIGGFISMLTFVGTIISSLFSSRLVKKFGTGMVTAVSTLMTAVGLFVFSFSQNAVWLFVVTVPLGLGAGAVDSVLNNFVAMHFSGRVMSFLHCFYGVGIAVSPYLMSFSLADGNWRGGYRTACAVQFVIAFITIISLPLWRKFSEKSESSEDIVGNTLTVSQIIHMPGYIPAALAFLFSCSIEAICNQWASTFLVDARGLTADSAARIITFYYIGMALGRFLSGVVSERFTSWQIIGAGVFMLIPASLLLNFGSGDILCGAGLFLIGLGNGPLFPNLVHITPTSYGAENSQSMMSAQLAFGYSGLAIFPSLFGELFDVSAFPIFQSVLFLLLICSVIAYNRIITASKRLER